MTYPEFQAKWTNPAGQRIDFDHVYQFQCVDLILEYIYECYGLTGVRGNAIDYWTAPSPPLLTKFDKLGGTQIQTGDIVVLNGLLGNPFGHIGIGTGAQNANQAEILEQNGADGNGSGVGGDAIRTRWIYKNRIAGVLRPKTVPVSSPAPQPMYVVVEEYQSGKQVRLNKQPTRLWGMNYAFNYMKDHPVETHNQGEVWTVTNKVRHQDGYYYYRRAGQVDGFNVLDCDDVVPASAAPAPPVTPQPAKLPQGALAVPSGREYVLVVPLKGYMTATLAAQGAEGEAKVTLPPGRYFIYNTYPHNVSLINVTKTDGRPGAWINSALNVKAADPAPALPPAVTTAIQTAGSAAQAIAVTTTAPPAVAAAEVPNDWQKTFHRFPGGPVRYRALEALTILDIAALDPVGIRVPEGEVIPFPGYFIRNNIHYLLCRLASDTEKQHYYGVPVDNIEIGSPLLVSELYDNSRYAQKENRDYRRAAGHMTTEDKIFFAQQTIARAVNDGARFINGIIPLSKLAAWKKPKK